MHGAWHGRAGLCIVVQQGFPTGDRPFWDTVKSVIRAGDYLENH